MVYENVLLVVKNHIATVTVNRPDKANALNMQTFLELKSAFSQIKGDGNVHAIIVTGSGERFFVAGADIQELKDLNAESGIAFARHGQEVFSLIEHLGKPVIAAVNGFALGGGCELALACSLRIASEKAQFGFPEVSLGVIPGFGGTQRLPRLVGKAKAVEMILTGDMIDAKEAFRIGLVNAVAGSGSLAETAESMCRKIIKNAPLAIRYSLDAVNSGLEMTQTEGIRLEASLFGLSCATEDKNTGVAAFLKKEGTPRFTGR